MSHNLIIIGISGGSGSGKSSISRNILSQYGEEKCAIIEVDSYYKDLKQLSMEEREKTNFDHPDSIDFELMQEDLNKFILGKGISVPIYDYKTHTRTNITRDIKSQSIIIIEGIFALLNPNIRSLMSIKVFVDTEDKIRLARRIKRDMKYRKRTYESIIKQYDNNVRPMYDNYVAPLKNVCDLVITGGVKNTVAMEQLISKITDMDNSTI
ncbi:MAG: uridine kinase [Candidatus Marinimicrobia bacterium]|nr:uridine kinase [Candidatus Neomarinimicrobiota bacterium]|tara:strand:- start:1917 stop:2546 length:630 start_codon:yes stop_codon:yes gene_type:complete